MRAVAVALFALFAFSTANAQTTEDKQKAQAAFADAKDLYEKGEHRAAIKKLEYAYSLFPNPAIAITIARRYMDLDEPRAALRELKKLEPAKKKLKEMVEAEIATIEALLAKPVEVTLKSIPPGAMIAIDGGPPSKSPVSANMERGAILVQITLKHHKTVKETVDVKGTKPLEKVWRLEKVGSQLTIRLGNRSTDPKGPTPILTLDGAIITPGQALDVEPGRHTVECGYPGQEARTNLRYKVPAGKTLNVSCALPDPPESPSNWKSPVGWTAIGVGVAAVAGGIAMLAINAINADQYPSPQYQIDENSMPVGGGVATGLGAAALGVGLWMVLTAPD